MSVWIAERPALTAVDVRRDYSPTELDILRLYSRGRGLKETAIQLRVDDSAVASLITEIKFNRGLAAQIVQEQEHAAALAARPPAPKPTPATPPRRTPAVPASPPKEPPMTTAAPSIVEETTGAEIPAFGTVDDLIARAAASGNAKAQRLADRICEQLDELTQLMTRIDQESTLRTRLAKLNEELAATRKELDSITGSSTRVKPTTAPAAAVTVTSTIRTWARQESIPCPSMGRVPRGIVDAYNAAHPAAAA